MTCCGIGFSQGSEKKRGGSSGNAGGNRNEKKKKAEIFKKQKSGRGDFREQG